MRSSALTITPFSFSSFLAASISASRTLIINPHSLAIDNTFRIYDPGLTDYVDMSHDGTDFNTTGLDGTAFLQKAVTVSEELVNSSVYFFIN